MAEENKGVQVSDSKDFTKTTGKALKGLGLAALGALTTYYGLIFYGIMDYLYQPECFRAGDVPEPSSEAAPGHAEITPDRVRASVSDQVVTLRFTAGPGGISEDGGLKVGLCRLARFPDGRRRADLVSQFGWGVLQNTRPKHPDHFSVDLISRGGASLEVENKPSLPIRFFLRIAAREWMRRRGGNFKRLDYDNLFLEHSKIKIRVRGGRLEQGDEVVVTMGDRLRGGSGWRVPVRPVHAEFLVEVDEKALGRYRLIEELPAIDVVQESTDLLELSATSH